jgi:hypothetical protein
MKEIMYQRHLLLILAAAVFLVSLTACKAAPAANTPVPATSAATPEVSPASSSITLQSPLPSAAQSLTPIVPQPTPLLTMDIPPTPSISVSDYDYFTVMLDSQGYRVWRAYYNGPGKSLDEASAIAADKNGGVYVTGANMNNGHQTD